MKIVTPIKKFHGIFWGGIIGRLCSCSHGSFFCDGKDTQRHIQTDTNGYSNLLTQMAKRSVELKAKKTEEKNWNRAQYREL